MVYFRLLILSLILFSSCELNEPKPVGREELIAGTSNFGKTWQINQIEVELGALTPKRCITDNFITYFPNSRYEMNEGATKCESSDPPAISGNWIIEDDETLIITFSDSVQVWDIESLVENQQIISSEFEEGSRTYTLFSSN